MDIEAILSRLRDIRDDCHSASGCSHEDVLQDALYDAHLDLNTLIKDIEREATNGH